MPLGAASKERVRGLLAGRALPTGPAAHAERKSHREHWFRAALDATAEADLVFLDPDNGLEVGISRSASKGPKYVFLDDLESFVTRGQSLVVYQHIGRDAPARD